MRALVLLRIDQHTTFDMLSFTHDSGPKFIFLNWSRDPDVAYEGVLCQTKANT